MRESPLRLFLYAALIFTPLIALTWVNNYESCLRQEAPRSGVRLVSGAAYWARTEDAAKAAESGDRPQARRYRLLARTYLRAWRDAGELDCGLPWPDAEADPQEGLPPNPIPA